jgi:excisionase family DNA binding protein
MEKVYEPRLLSIGEAARMLGVHTNTLRSWADKGLVDHVRLPSGYRRFRLEVIQAMQVEMGLKKESTKKDEQP